jgi:hypothetical protein
MSIDIMSTHGTSSVRKISVEGASAEQFLNHRQESDQRQDCEAKAQYTYDHKPHRRKSPSSCSSVSSCKEA